MINSLKSILLFLGLFLLFLMCAFPFMFYPIKIIIMVILAFTSIGFFLTGGYVVNSFVKKWAFFYLAFGLVFSLIGLLNKPLESSNVISSMTVSFVWPIFFYILIPLYSQVNNVFLRINKTLVFSSFFIGIYITLGALSYLGILPMSKSFFVNTSLIEGKYDAAIQLFDPSITSLMFLIPFVISYVLLKENIKDKSNGFFLIITIMVSVFALVISGRRALILNLILSPVILYSVIRFSSLKDNTAIKKTIIRYFLFSIILIFSSVFILQFLELINLEGLKNSFLQSFDFARNSKDVSSEVRGMQVEGLLKSFFDYPLFGSGLGTKSEFVIRNFETPWIYELSYFAILYQTGVVGFFIYTSLLLSLMYRIISLISISTKFIIPYIVGYISFLIANASNPYLWAFDHLWTIFLPLAVLNFCLINKLK